MKKLIALLTILTAATASAQIKVKVNDKLITEATVLKAEDIKNLSVAFDKPKKLSYYGTGRLYFLFDFIGEKGEIIESYRITKDGTNSVESFLSDVNTFYNLPSDATPKSPFECAYRITVGHGINSKLMYFGKNYGYKTVKFTVTVGFRDKIGYEKYGDFVTLVKEQTYTIDNTTLYNDGQKLKAEEKIAADAKKAEDDKKAEEARKEAESKEKAKKGKGLLRGVLNKL